MLGLRPTVKIRLEADCPPCFSALRPRWLSRSASEPRGNIKPFKDFYLKAKALTVLYVPYLLGRCAR